MRKFIGLVAIMFGIVGLLLLAAGGAAAWRFKGVVVDRTGQATARMSDRLSKIEAKLQRLEGKISELKLDAEDIRAVAVRIVGQPVKNALIQTELKQLFDRLSRLLDQSQNLGETLDIVANLVEDVADLGAQIDGDKDRMDRLRMIAESIEQAAASLAGIRKKLSKLHLPDTELDPQNLSDLASQTLAPMDRLAKGVASVSQCLGVGHETLEQIRREVRRWMRIGTSFVVIMLTCFGLGQICLLTWGSRQLRSAQSSASGNKHTGLAP